MKTREQIMGEVCDKLIEVQRRKKKVNAAINSEIKELQKELDELYLETPGQYIEENLFTDKKGTTEPIVP